MRKIIGILTLAMLCTMLMPADVLAYDASLPYVVDTADLLTPEEETSLEAFLTGVSDEAYADIVVLTVDSLEGKNAQAYADDYFDYSGYGRGERYDGALFLIAMEERQWAISTSGYGITAIHEGALDYMEETIVPYLSDGAYYMAFLAYGDTVRAYWRAEPGETPHGYEPDPYYGDAYYGESAGSGFSPGAFLPVALLFGFLIALIPMGVLKSQLNAVHMQTGAVLYQKTDGVRITDAKDLYLYRNLTKKPIPREDPVRSGGSRPGGHVHTGSSGRSHGGRSGGF